MPNVMAALPNIGGTICSTPQSLAGAHYQSAVQSYVIVPRWRIFLPFFASCIFSVPRAARFRPAS